jgi:YfiH family protein
MWTSDLLEASGLRHGFSTRAEGDAREDPIREKLSASLGLEGVATGAQVHGAEVAWPSQPGPSRTEADGLASKGEPAVGVLTADCVPLLVFDPITGLGAALHAGWRGVLAGVAVAGLEALCRAGAEKDRLLVALGPRIQPCCYQVGEDLARRFVERFGATVERRTDTGVFLDLAAAVRIQLREQGLRGDQVEALDLCTACRRGPDDAFLFHSYRRDGPFAGRQLSLLAPGPSASRGVRPSQAGGFLDT